jgi:cytochrome b6
LAAQPAISRAGPLPSTRELQLFFWLDDRLALQEILEDVGSKFVPPHVNIFYCFGGYELTAFLVQVATGFALTFYYRPAVSEALASVRSMRYSLPYDQVGYWALRIVSGVPDCIPLVGQVLVELIRGGPSVGQATLTRFYSLHTFVLPLVTLALMLVHFLLIRKQGISGPL